MNSIKLADAGQPFQFKIGENVFIDIDANGNITMDPAAVSGGVLNLVGNLAGRVTGGVMPPLEAISGDGAITVPTNGMSVVLLSKGSAAAITIPVPTLAQNGTIIFVHSLTGYAHVITQATDGFNAKGSSGTATAATTFTGLLMLYANAGHWYTLAQNLWTIA